MAKLPSGQPKSSGDGARVPEALYLDLTRSIATLADDADFAAFCCCGDNDPAWIEEVEDYVRGSVLRRVEHTLAFRDGQGDLIAVSAFAERVIRVPIVDPVAHEGWHLQVVAISLEHQRQRLSKQIFEQTFAAMREIDASRVYVTANVHREHRSSRKACSEVGIDLWTPLDDHYVVLLGEVPSS
ncbi:MAG: hypothetical protein ACR2QA_13465 [Solirubrobacteraceae bacterium]